MILIDYVLNYSKMFAYIFLRFPSHVFDRLN